MKKILYAILISVFSLSFYSCHDEPEYRNDLLGNFYALADIIDQHYCFFEDKNLDWN